MNLSEHNGFTGRLMKLGLDNHVFNLGIDYKNEIAKWSVNPKATMEDVFLFAISVLQNKNELSDMYKSLNNQDY